ncbi:MAG: hypothetical protein NTX82_01035, partial [Candidatus Parcubacteria bacterium]|nr:hypothetical protein [Candidatus Parcubacteria bacterium]
YQYKKQKETERALLQKVKAKLSNAQNKQLENILTNTDEFQMFLKSVSGKLTAAQAQELKSLIEKRNQEVVDQGLQPIDKIILHKTFSFAPWMLLGVIITLITRSSLIHLVYQLLGR